MSSQASALCKDDSPYKAPDYDEKVLEEIDTVTVELSINEFEEYIPGENMTTEQENEALDVEPMDFSLLQDESEDARYDPICCTFNSITGLACENRIWKIVATLPESSRVDFRCDIALYPKDEPKAINAYTRDLESDNPHVARCAWAWMIIPVEVKCEEEDSAYGFSFKGSGRNTFLRDTDKGREARAQFAKYATELMLRQHRTHLFSLYMTGNGARFARWDRAGCIVSQPIDLRVDFRRFRNILYRLSRLSPSDLGFDETVELASDADIRELRSYIPTNPHLQEYRRIILRNQLLFPLYKLNCPVISMEGPLEDTPQERAYLIGKQTSDHFSPTGRCTRGYVAFDLESRCLVFLKDQWRAETRARTEIETYRRLHRHKVPCIATPVAGGDIPTHRTETQNKLGHLPKTKRPVRRIHTRLVTKDVGLPLEKYVDSLHLLQICTFAVVAHQAAWERARVLHHDISAGNIMIDVNTGNGFLNDWDLAKYEEDLLAGKSASEPAGVSGTWPYKSALGQRYPRKPAEVADDLESFVYVILFNALRFHRHQLMKGAPDLLAPVKKQREYNAKNEGLASLIYYFFHHATRHENGYTSASDQKWLHIEVGRPPITLEAGRHGQTPLARWLARAYRLLHEHYKTIDLSELERFGVPETNSDSPAGSNEESHAGAPDEPEEKDWYIPSVLEAHSLPVNLPQEDPASPASSTTSSRSRHTFRTSRPLDTHSALLKLFDSAFKDDDGRPLNLRFFKGDKWWDLCNGQRVFTSSKPKNPSGGSGSRSSSDTPSSKGRKSKSPRKTTSARKIAAAAKAQTATKATVRKTRIRTKSKQNVKSPAVSPPAKATRTRDRLVTEQIASPEPDPPVRRSARLRAPTASKRKREEHGTAAKDDAPQLKPAKALNAAKQPQAKAPATQLRARAAAKKSTTPRANHGAGVSTAPLPAPQRRSSRLAAKVAAS